MARPVPIIIPGPSGFGQNMTETSANVDLGAIMNLLGIGPEAEKKARVNNLIATLASAPMPEQTADQSTMTTPGGQMAAVNMPSGGGIDPQKYAALQLAQQSAPEQFGNELASFLFPKQATAQAPHTLSAGQSLVDPTGKTLASIPKDEAAKEVNLPVDIDSFLTTKYGGKYTYAKPSERSGYVDYLTTPEGKKEFDAYLQKAVSRKEGGITDRSKENQYLRVVGLADNDDMVKQFKRTQSVKPYVKKSLEIFKRTGNAGLLQDALIYSHNKTLDADSVVMVSEYLRSKGQQSLADRVMGNINKVFEGSAGLGPEMQSLLLEAVSDALDKKEKSYNQRMRVFRKMAGRYNTDKDEVNETFPLSNELPGYEPEATPYQGAPTPSPVTSPGKAGTKPAGRFVIKEVK